MRLAALLAVLSCLDASFAAAYQVFPGASFQVRTFTDDITAARQGIDGARSLDSDTIDQLNEEFDRVLSLSKCTVNGVALDCAVSPAASITAAEAALGSLNQDLNNALNKAKDAKSLASRIAAEYTAYQAQLNGAAKTASNRTALLQQLGAIMSAAGCSMSPVDCSRSTDAKLTAAQNALEQLEDKIGLAINGANDDKAAAGQLTAALTTLQNTLQTDPRAAAAKAALLQQLGGVISAAGCSPSPINCSASAGAKLAAGQAALRQLQAQVGNAINQAAANKAVTDTLTAGLTTALNLIQTDTRVAAAKTALLQQFGGVVSAAGCSPSPLDCSASAGAKLAAGQAGLQQLQAQIATAINQAAANNAVTNTLTSDLTAVLNLIQTDPRVAYAKAALLQQFGGVVSAAGCSPSPLSCSASTGAKLTAGQAALQQLQNQIGTVINQGAANKAVTDTLTADLTTALNLIQTDPRVAYAKTALLQQFSGVVSAAGCSPSPLDCSASSGAKLTAGQAALQQLQNQIGTVINQGAANKAAATKLAAVLTAVLHLIQTNPKLASAQSDLLHQFTSVLSAAGCSSNPVDCSGSSADELAAAQAALQQLQGQIANTTNGK